MRFFSLIILLYFFIQGYRILLIVFDERVTTFLKRYQKKEKIIQERKLLFDKNNLLLNYSFFENQRYTRQYLFPELIPILGLVGFEGRGMSGVEQSLEKKLLSPACYKTMHVFSGKDQAGYVLSSELQNRFNLSINAPLSLSIFYLLKLTVEKYHSNFGCCIVMNGTSGEIESYVQFPFYNPQSKESDLSFLYPFGITQAYELGSVVKAFLMLAALEERVVNPETLVNCYGVKEKKFKNRIISTWKAHGLISFKEVIKGSNNIGVAQVGLKIGKKLYDYYKKCGFGKGTGIEICGEHKGILHHPDSWSKQSLVSLTFGYEVALTLLQGVTAWSLFLNEGRRVRPTLLNMSTEISDPYFSEKAIHQARDILELDQKGMKSFGLKKKLKGRIFGKTGTANVLINNEYVKEKNTYSFLGHYEAGETKKIVGIFIHGSNDHTLYASDVALPLFLSIVPFFEIED
jgi:cell division protein FtsI (penicillin-binding protein 3)